MKKTILIAALGLFSLSVMAQDAKPEEGFVFTTVKENPITSIKNQNRSSTCWSFSTLGFVESELLRLGKGEYDLSEMFVVHKTMQDRGVNYVRYHGDTEFFYYTLFVLLFCTCRTCSSLRIYQESRCFDYVQTIP